MQSIRYIWTGTAMQPENEAARREADRRFGQGEVVPLDVANPRSKVSHDHFFAVVADAHGTLPEAMAERYPTPDSLRHFALCKAGYCDVERFVASSKAEALRLAGFVRSGAGDGVQVVVDGNAITRLTPHSQSVRSMGAKTFQESKSRCLEVIADLLDVPVQALGMARAA